MIDFSFISFSISWRWALKTGWTQHKLRVEQGWCQRKANWSALQTRIGASSLLGVFALVLGNHGLHLAILLSTFCHPHFQNLASDRQKKTRIYVTLPNLHPIWGFIQAPPGRHVDMLATLLPDLDVAHPSYHHIADVVTLHRLSLKTGFEKHDSSWWNLNPNLGSRKLLMIRTLIRVVIEVLVKCLYIRRSLWDLYEVSGEQHSGKTETSVSNLTWLFPCFGDSLGHGNMWYPNIRYLNEETSLKMFGKSWMQKSDPSLWTLFGMFLTKPSISFSSGTTNAYVGTPLFRAGEPTVRLGTDLASFATWPFCSRRPVVLPKWPPVTLMLPRPGGCNCFLQKRYPVEAAVWMLNRYTL